MAATDLRVELAGWLRRRSRAAAAAATIAPGTARAPSPPPVPAAAPAPEPEPEPAPAPAPEPHNMDEPFFALQDRVRSYTMTSPERMYALYNAVRHLVSAGVPGDVVECGVWRGGSMMLTALTLLAESDTSRDLHLFDTFEGMVEPTEHDVLYTGEPAAQVMTHLPPHQVEDGAWCLAAQDDVARNMASTGYPADRVHLVRGRVEETVPEHAPASIALLRLDTDWYASTYHELQNLYPRLASGGVLIIDDYGWWQGSREATDRYFAEVGGRPLLHRIDGTGRIAVKP